MNGKRFDSWRDNHKCGFDTVADFPNKGHIRAYYDVGFEYDENIMKAEKTDRQWTDGNVSFEAGEVYKIVGLREGETVFTVVDERDYTSIFKSMSVIFSFSSTESCT